MAVGGGDVTIAGIFPAVGNPATAVRINASLNALAAQADNVISVLTPQSGVLNVYYAAGNWIASDGTLVASSSDNGAIWAAALSTGGGTINTAYGLIRDDVNDMVIAADSTNTGGVLVSNSVNPLNLTAVAVSTSEIGSVGYKGAGTGITLAVAGPGGADNGVIYKSTDGGAVWAQVGQVTFVNAGGFIGFGQTHWLSVGTSGTAGGQVQVSLSTDDGTTWTAPTTLPGSNNNSAAIAIATDGAGRWVITGANAPPDNYWVSTDDGVTWSSPNDFATQDGAGPGRVIWNPTAGQFQAAWIAAGGGSQFLSTSTDGLHWTVGPTITDTV